MDYVLFADIKTDLHTANVVVAGLFAYMVPIGGYTNSGNSNWPA